jgi:hypothetical protein
LLNFKDKINEVLENKEALSIELQEAMEHMKNVATYQDEKTSDIMCMLTKTFQTDIKYLLPQ